MKKLLLILFSGVLAIPGYSQMSVWKPSGGPEVALEVSVYDSLHVNFQKFTNEESHKYRQYIGQQLFFIPLTEAVRGEFNFPDFIVSAETVLKGQELLPFKKTTEGQSIQNRLKRISVLDKVVIMRDMKKAKEDYEKKFDFQTNVYKPVFTTYKLRNESGDVIAPIGTDVTFLENKLFRILDVYRGTSLQDMAPLTSKSDADPNGLLFMLADQNGDTLYWKTTRNKMAEQKRLVVQGYYDKHAAYYKNRELVYRKDIPREYVEFGDLGVKNDYKKIINSGTKSVNGSYTDLNTGQAVQMAEQGLWICRDVALIENGSLNSLYYVLSSETGNTIKVPIGELAQNGFVCKQSYEAEMSERKLKDEEREAVRQKEELRRKEAAKERMKNLTTRFGQKNAALIAEGKVAVGMTKEMCSEAWGKPSSITAGSGQEIWIYGYTSSLYFFGNKLVQIMNLQE